MRLFVANPLQIKYIPGRKNDDIDSEWIAEVCLNGQIKPSYIPCREIRDLRELTRTHVKFTEARTALKNKVHKYCIGLVFGFLEFFQIYSANPVLLS